MEESINMNRTELITMSPLVLAYLGDTVFESHIREYLITKNINKKVNDLHKSAVKYVNAKAQATIIHNIDYKHATGFEALIGYLYLDKNYKRLEYIISEGIKIVEANM